MDLAAIVTELKRSTDTFGPFVRRQAQAIPDRVALKFETESVTYGAYDAAVNRLAWVLARDGVRAGMPVAILAPNSPLFLVALGAVAKLGAIGALINTHVTGPGLTHLLRAPGATSRICDRSAPPGRSFSARHFLDDVRRHEAVAFVYVGEFCRYLLRQPATAHDRDHRLRVAAGAGLRPDIWTTFVERFGIARVVEMYGATEGNVALQNLDNRPGSVGKPHAMLADQVALARVDLATGTLVRSADGLCIACADGEPGELLGKVGLSGGMEYDGYTDREATERKLVRGAFAPDDAWFRSGDLLRRDAEGYYYFIDRVGDTFRWKGENVATMEVADRLNAAPGVTEANVFGVAVPGEDGRAGMAALVLRDGTAFDGAAFFAHAERHLPRYAMPAFVRLVPAMDVTGTLKQRKQVFAADGWDPARTSDPLFVRDDARQTYVPLDGARLAALRSGALRL